MALEGKDRAGVKALGGGAKPALAVVGTFVLALFAHGCATSGDTPQEIRTDKEYRTGSNIPTRDRSSDSKSVDPASVQDALRRSPPAAPAGLKGGG